jgi:hypothetical protein
MKNNKILIISIIALVLINIVTIAFVLTKNEERIRRGGNPERRQKMIEKRLELTPKQTQQFRAAHSEHDNWVENNAKTTFNLRKQLYHAANANDTIKMKILSDSLGQLQAKKEMATVAHFAALRKICNTKQQQKMDKMLLRQMERMQKR